MTPYENVIVGNSFEEIVFTNRNKEYGAYVLRKKQKRYLLIAFALAFLFVTSSVVTPMIYNHMKGNSTLVFNDSLTVISEIDTTLRVTPPEPPKILADQNVARFVPPQVVEDADTTEDAFAAMERLMAENTNVAPPALGTDTIEREVISDPEPPTIVIVEEPAKFNGGDINEFNKWVGQHLEYPQLAIENQIAGKVIVQFVVNNKGKVESVNIMRGVDPSLDQEAIRVITSSPLWSPPKQGGRPVKQLFTLPVNFQLKNN